MNLIQVGDVYINKIYGSSRRVTRMNSTYIYYNYKKSQTSRTHSDFTNLIRSGIWELSLEAPDVN